MHNIIYTIYSQSAIPYWLLPIACGASRFARRLDFCFRQRLRNSEATAASGFISALMARRSLRAISDTYSPQGGTTAE